MALPPEIIKELVATFRVDVDDQLQVITDTLLALETETDKIARRDLLHSAMRAAHNLKGAARGIGVSNVGEISHSLENLLTKLMKSRSEFSAEITNLCLETVDAIKIALQSYIDETNLPFDKAELIKRLDKGETAKSVKLPVPPASELTSTIEQASIPETAPVLEQEERKKTTPEAIGIAKPEKGGEILRVSVDKLDRLESLFEEIHATKIDLDDFIQELRTTQTVIYTGQTENSEQPDKMAANLERVVKSMRARGRTLGVTLSAVRHEMRELRLVPALGLTRPLTRSVRDIAQQMDKKVTFTTIGEDTEMDRAVMDLLKDPLTHLLRNSLDHGIESPAERKAAGKSETGSIELLFRLESGMVRIELTDDGCGIDIDMVRETAVAKKVISQNDSQIMSREEILNLIFHPGFSTKKIITDVSGRGVGMDIVMINVQALRGDIAVDTRKGEGSTFTLSVPLTIATERGLVVRAADQVFAIPIANVERVLDAAAEDLIDVEGGKSLMIDDHPVTFRILSNVLGLGAVGDLPSKNIQVMVLKVGWRRVALVVDDILGQREIVVRPLSAPLVNVRGITGGTLIGGQVRMVLDPEGIVDSALKSAADFDLSSSSSIGRAKRVLAVDDSLTTRTLVKNVLESAGYDVTTAINGKEAWNVMHDTLFDIVVTDVEMPIMNGFELTKLIKESDKLADVPVIIVTSLTSEEDKDRGVEVGADAYIVKSDFETSVLLDVMEQLI